MRLALSREKPKSIMRRTATGTTKVVTAAVRSASSAASARQRPLRLLDRSPHRTRGVSLGDVHLKLPFATSAERGQSGATMPRRAAGINRRRRQARRLGCDLFPPAAWAIEPRLFLDFEPRAQRPQDDDA